MNIKITDIPNPHAGPPRLHSPKIISSRVGNPFFHTLPCAGERPLSFSAIDLPSGLKLDPQTGIITGKLNKKEETYVKISASNRQGRDESELIIKTRKMLCPLPLMGWSQWYCLSAEEVSDENIRKMAQLLVDTGLAAHGYCYVNIDDGWQGDRDPNTGMLQANDRFPDMKDLTKFIHSLGLKAGIYSTPWVKSYAGYTGGTSGECLFIKKEEWRERGWYIGKKCHAEKDAYQFAEWGFDFLKYDWNPVDRENVETISHALKSSGRDMVLSLSNAVPFENATIWSEHANLWRIGGDIRDTWESLCLQLFLSDYNKWAPFAGPGHWNDPDMLMVGEMRMARKDEKLDVHNRLTLDERITNVTFNAITAAPLIVSCDLSRLDRETFNLIANDEVLDVNQDPLGKQGVSINQMSDDGLKPAVPVFIKELDKQQKAVAVFNLSGNMKKVDLSPQNIGMKNSCILRDCWAKRDIGVIDSKFTVEVPPHGARLLRAKAEE